jgi:hypothetical protein
VIVLTTSRRFKLFIAVIYLMALLAACAEVRSRRHVDAAVIAPIDPCTFYQGWWNRWVRGCDGLWPNFN